MRAIGIYDFYLRDNCPMKYPEFSNRLKQLIKDKKGDLSQLEVAKWLGVSQPTINSWLQGEAMPGMPKSIECCNKLDCCVEYFLTGKGPKRFVVDLTDDKHLRILQALKSAKAAIEYDGSEEAKKNEDALYRFAIDRVFDGNLTDSQLKAFLSVLVSK
jgi:hypothetical protein